MRILLRAATAAFAAACLPAAARAHTTIEGIDAVYGGFLHPYFVPQHLLALIALALLVGSMNWRAAAIGLPLFLARPICLLSVSCQRF